MDTYQVITNRILEMLDKGVAPWKCPFKRAGIDPSNLASKKPYNGVNLWLLACSPFASPWYVTARQAKAMGGNVRDAEVGIPVVFWKFYSKENPEDSPDAETAGDNRPTISRNGGSAFYLPTTDRVNVPPMGDFRDSAEVYSVFFHELGHSTGHKSRLSHKSLTDKTAAFGSATYAKEELVAEFCAAYLCGEAGIVDRIIDNAASYCKSWAKKIREDKRLIVFAAAQGHKAAKYILGK